MAEDKSGKEPKVPLKEGAPIPNMRPIKTDVTGKKGAPIPNLQPIPPVHGAPIPDLQPIPNGQTQAGSTASKGKTQSDQAETGQDKK